MKVWIDQIFSAWLADGSEKYLFKQKADRFEVNEWNRKQLFSFKADK